MKTAENNEDQLLQFLMDQFQQLLLEQHDTFNMKHATSK